MWSLDICMLVAIRISLLHYLQMLQLNIFRIQTVSPSTLSDVINPKASSFIDIKIK